MSMPGELGFLREAIFAQLANRQQPLTIPAEHPERPWLEWLKVPLTAGPLPNLSVQPLTLNAADLRKIGILPEIVYAGLVQTRWHPRQSDWVARTRSEIYACFQASEMTVSPWELDLDTLKQLNAYRLQELTPGQLLEASREFWSATSDATEQMEGWLLLNINHLKNLQDVADCLVAFLYQGPPRQGLTQAEIRQWLHIPDEISLSDALKIIGSERAGKLLL